MRRIVPILALLLLNACNIVVSREPWFTLADERGGFALRPGVWNWTVDQDCPIDESLPADHWPECAAPVIVRDHRWLAVRPVAKNEPSELSYILAAGEPLILQLSNCTDTTNDPEMPKFYCYLGITPAGLDREGRLTRLKAWLVLCGPPRKDGPLLGPQATRHPYKGLKVIRGICEAKNADAVRAAARSSEAEAQGGMTDKAVQPHWVRDGDR